MKQTICTIPDIIFQFQFSRYGLIWHIRGDLEAGDFSKQEKGPIFLVQKEKKNFLHWISNFSFSANCWAGSLM